MTNATDQRERTVLGRRSFLRHLLVGGAAVLAGGCSSPRQTSPGPAPSGAARSVLLAYFSRHGENYFNGGRINLQVGNTEVLAGMIRERIACDVHRIRPVDPYPQDYEQTVARNVREQNADARPAIAGRAPSIDRYDVVLLASPIWNVRAPMIMSTFTEGLDFTGKIVFPVTTHAMSGLGGTERDYAASCRGATIGEGLAVRGEEVAGAGPAVDSWLRGVGLG